MIYDVLDPSGSYGHFSSTSERLLKFHLIFVCGSLHLLLAVAEWNHYGDDYARLQYSKISFEIFFFSLSFLFFSSFLSFLFSSHVWLYPNLLDIHPLVPMHLGNIGYGLPSYCMSLKLDQSFVVPSYKFCVTFIPSSIAAGQIVGQKF